MNAYEYLIELKTFLDEKRQQRTDVLFTLTKETKLNKSRGRENETLARTVRQANKGQTGNLITNVILALFTSSEMIKC